MSEVITTLFLFTALLTLFAIVIFIFLHLYEIFEEPNIQARMRKLRKPVQPWVTVLLYSHNDEKDIEPSVKALLRSNYHNFDIVVIHDSSHDNKQALKKGYSKSQKGKIVITLQAGVIVPPSFIKRAVATKGVYLRSVLSVDVPIQVNSLTNIIKSLNSIFGQQTQKVQVGDASNIVGIKKRVSLEFLIVLFFTGITALSIVTHEPIAIWYGWLIYTAYMFSLVWLGTEKVNVKIKLSFSAFSAFFVLPVAYLPLLLSQFRTRN